jgi:predicted transcriptional regulator
MPAVSYKMGKSYINVHSKKDPLAGTDPSLRYFIRIVKILQEHNPIGITDLATFARMNHQRCAPALQWLEHMDYIVIQRFDNGRMIINVTEKGRDYLNRLASLPLPAFLLLISKFVFGFVISDIL